jgi:alcohol dehydrogenase
MDTAKGGNFIFTNGGEIRDYWGVGKATRPMLPLIAIPTTAGTGSECQCAALIADQQTHQKMACLDPKAAARIALLDPTLTLSQPARVTACTGIDAITHAVETAVTKARTPVSVMYSQAAFGHLVGAFPRVMANAGALDARGRMLLGAALAGSAIENSMLGAAHSAANPLTAHFDLPHGLAVGLMLPHVMRFNAAEDHATQRAYADLAASAGITAVGGNPAETVAALAARMEELLDLATCPRSLADCGIGRDAIPALAVEAARQWTAKFNPRPVCAEVFVGLYEAALSGRCR